MTTVPMIAPAGAGSHDCTLTGRSYRATDGIVQANAQDVPYLLEAGFVPAVKLIELQIAVGDETTPITTGTAKVKFRSPRAFTLATVRGSLSTEGTTGTTVNVKMGGVSIFTTNKLTIDSGSRTSVGAATAPRITTTAVTDDAEFSIDIDAAGTDAAGLKLTLLGVAP